MVKYATAVFAGMNQINFVYFNLPAMPEKQTRFYGFIKKSPDRDRFEDFQHDLYYIPNKTQSQSFNLANAAGIECYI